MDTFLPVEEIGIIQNINALDSKVRRKKWRRRDGSSLTFWRFLFWLLRPLLP
jgi:hypothetical protein